MECDRMRCVLNKKGMCGGARTIHADALYLSQRGHWETVAGWHNVVRRVGNAAPITPEQVRENQIKEVRKRSLRIIAQHCRPQDTALREALSAYNAAAELPLPPGE